MRVIFMGTPEFAVPALGALIKHHEVAAVVTQPDRPGNRGGVTFSPVKRLALSSNIPLYQFEKISKEGIGCIKSYSPDAIVTAAYGQILSREVFGIPKHGIFNVHASLLPKYRGSSPIQWSIINGEKETGVTIMKTAEGLDTGDILLQRKTAILQDDDAVTMFEKLSLLGADAIIDALALIESGGAEYIKQNNDEATYFPMLKKADGKIDWADSAENIFNKVRGMCGWPVAFTSYKGKMLKIYKCALAPKISALGEITVNGSDIVVSCGSGGITLCSVQLEGKNRMTAHDFANGCHIQTGDKFE